MYLSTNEMSEAELVSASLAVLDRLELPVDVHTAWISGSLVEGLGNTSSDVDIFVAMQGELGDVALTRRGSDHGVYAFVESGVRFDVELWPLEDIKRLASKLSDLPVDDPQRNNLHFLNYWETEFVHRLFVGVPLRHQLNFDLLGKLFDRKRFSRFLMDTAIRRADDAFDDAVGMLRAGHLRSAALRAREAVQFSVDAVLYVNGVTNDKTKFRIRKLELLSSNEPEVSRTLQQLWQFESHIPEDELGIATYVEDALRFSSDLVESAQMKVRTPPGRAPHAT
ncbi:HEPN domain-containing protein [Sorangium sp. So ce726]|uniref:HEPN domain-containing protein n=1 Tax=Sorangium sp. So ce726 TaxID=3133319 RepID=UPI003F5F2422